MSALSFSIIKSNKTGARAGVLRTPHGDIQTPAFIPVSTKATLKGVLPESAISEGVQATLANTYHLYLQPSAETVKQAGGLHRFMNWDKPLFTDSGGFQVMSLGAGFGQSVTKTFKGDDVLLLTEMTETTRAEMARGGRHPVENFKPAKIDEDGVLFYSHIDGSQHYFTPERSVEIQHDLGADIIFAFDECTLVTETVHYERRALDRTHRWAKRCVKYHQESGKADTQALFGIVQGGTHEALRKESAEFINALGFDGYGIGGAITRTTLPDILSWTNAILDPQKPRHLLGIGEPEDIIVGIRLGCDTFDCVAATRIARTGQLYTAHGKINILNSGFRQDFAPIDSGCTCYTCVHYTKAYVAHLFRADEMLGPMLASIHNVHFITNLVDTLRHALLEDRFEEVAQSFLDHYLKPKKGGV